MLSSTIPFGSRKRITTAGCRRSVWSKEKDPPPRSWRRVFLNWILRINPTDLVQDNGTKLTRRNSLNCFTFGVEDRGFEPLTSCMPCKRSPS